jgi:hypothetical protein
MFDEPNRVDLSTTPNVPETRADPRRCIKPLALLRRGSRIFPIKWNQAIAQGDPPVLRQFGA